MKKFNLYFSVLSLIVDALAIFAGLLVAYFMRLELAEAEGTELFAWPFDRYFRFALMSLPLWVALLAAQGLYNPRQLLAGWSAFGKVVIGLLSGWGAVLIILYVSRLPEAQFFPRLIIVYGVVTTVVATGIGRLLLNLLKSRLYRLGKGRVATAVVTNDSSSWFVDKLRREPTHGRNVVGVVSGDDINVLSSLKKTAGLEEIIIASQDLSEEQVLTILNWADANSVTCSLIPSILSVRSTNLEVGSLAGTPIMYFRRSPLDGWGRIYKRILDLIVVLPLIILLSPVYLLLALLVKLGSRGPVIYREKRVGQDGREFTVGKFRSMYADWRERMPDVKDWSADEATDPRITPIGRLIRRTNLDELPQLWDVLKGKMSLVGPRPEQPKYVAEFAKEIPDYLKRHYIKSGLTGWAQINGLRGDTSIEERVKYDLYYIENWSIWFDIRIIISTFVLMVRQLLGVR